jgi:hypothetical protein
MKKIPTVFERDWDGDRSRVIDKVHPGCEWVLAGEGVATRKYDGTSCMVSGGILFKRREIKAEQVAEKGFPSGWIEADHDIETDKYVGWVPVGEGPEDRAHREALPPAVGATLPDGTYELLGPKVQGNPEKYGNHWLLAHREAERFEDAPRTFAELRAWLEPRDIEGVVWHHPDGRMAKLKKRDFGFKR